MSSQSASSVADPRAIGAHECPRCGEPHSLDGCGCRQCEQCGRTGTRGFQAVVGLYHPGKTWFVCANKNACRKRWPKPLEVDE